MALNPFFKQLNYVPEQQLLESLGREMIQQYGLDVAYLRRKHVAIDPLFMEDPLSRFDDVRYVEMYIKNFIGYGQIADQMSKFGPLMNDKLILSVMRSRFTEVLPELTRPLEGDLIYIGMTNTLFEIKFVEHEDSFYQHGTLFYFDVVCERFNYSSETLETGIDEIDSIQQRYSTEVFGTNIIVAEDGLNLQSEDDSPLIVEQTFIGLDAEVDIENGSQLNQEDGDDVTTNAPDPFNPNIQNSYFQQESQSIIDFSETNPFGKM